MDNFLEPVKKNLDLIKNDLIEVHFMMDEEQNLLQLTKLNMYILESYLRGGGKLSYVSKRLKEKYDYQIKKKRLDKVLSLRDAKKYFEIRLKELGMKGSMTKENTYQPTPGSTCPPTVPKAAPAIQLASISP